MAPNSISKSNPNGYKPKGKKPTNIKKHFPLSREEQAAIDEFRAFYSESPKSNERKNDEKSGYKPADYNKPRAKMENPLPAGAKGLSASRWATSPKEEDKKRLLPEGTKGLAHSRFAKEASKDRAPFVPPISTTSTSKAKAQYHYHKKFGPTPEEDAAVRAFFAESPEDKEQKDNGESSYQAADHNTPRARMENPLPFGNKGLAGSRWAKKE
ncbi:hypothetical protein N0V85_002653 [Neurospora sp. IMI 360204]|nr:hypothetical protein N0V85_002653 [Neurospora sp. IMI 360204]